MSSYAIGFKNRMVQRMTGPRAISASALAVEVGVPQPTLSAWLRNARSLSVGVKVVAASNGDDGRCVTRLPGFARRRGSA